MTGKRWRTVLAFRTADWFALSHAYWLLLVLPPAMRILSFERLYRQLARRRRTTGRWGRADPLEAARVTHLVEVAAHYQPYRASCLIKALATYALLRRQGTDALLVIGVRSIEGTFQAHAWVEHAGTAADPRKDGWQPLCAF